MNHKEVLKEMALKTHDSDHGTSCIIVTNGNTLITSNQLPFGTKYYKERTIRPMKYNWIVHSEASAIALSAKMGVSTLGATMYMFWFPCQECAKLIVNSGIKILYCDTDFKEVERYQFGIAEQILKEGGVEILNINE